jgi:hypothetical protein
MPAHGTIGYLGGIPATHSDLQMALSLNYFGPKSSFMANGTNMGLPNDQGEMVGMNQI